jgi:hypothetical protein
MRSLHPRRTSALMLTAALALSGAGIAGCGQAIEQGAEQLAGDAIGGDVDIQDGGVTVKDEQGNDLSIGQDLSLPDSWPSDVPTFEGGTLVMVSVDADGASANAMWSSEGTASDALAQMKASLDSSGYTVESESAMGGLTIISATGPSYRVDVSVGDIDGTTSVTLAASALESPSP